MSEAAELPKVVITEPGIYDLTHKQYHDDPVPGRSLSSTGARKLTPPDGCAARFAWWRDHGDEPKRELNLGQIAHTELLGIGPEAKVLDYANYKTKAAQNERDQAYADGKVPILIEEMDQVQDMMLVLLEHPQAGKFYAPENGAPERSIFWQDPVFDVWRRNRLDVLSYLRHPDTGQLFVPEYKTTSRPAHPDRFITSALDHGYHQQGAWAADALRAMNLVKPGQPDPCVVMVVQEVKAPYIVSVIEMDREKLKWGRHLNALAMQTYVRCTNSRRWPAYSDGIMKLPPLAPFMKSRYQEYLAQIA